MKVRLALVVSMAVLLPLLPLQPATAGAAFPTLSGVGLAQSTVAAGTPLRVSGRMTAVEQPATRLWTDSTLTGDLGSYQYPSEPLLDLVEGGVRRARPGDPLTLTIKVADAVAETGPKPYMRYRWPFHLGDIWYFITFTYLGDGATGSWQGGWYYCKLALGSNCVHGTTPSFPVTFDAATRTFTGAIPLQAMAAVQPSGALVQDTMRPFSSQYPPEAGYAFPALTWTQDSSPAFTPHDVPIESVFVGIAPAGTPVASVTYTSSVPVTIAPGSMDVAFGGDVPTAGLAPGSYDLWLKACFGPCTEQPLRFTVS